jgi:hypothetical protein
VDRELAAALAGELPAAANVKVVDALPVSLTCPAGSAGASYDLRGGRLTFIMTQPNVMLPTWQLRDGSIDARSTASGGQTIVVVSEPFSSGGAAPFAADIEQFAINLGNRY